jgi:hypothetical protein
LQSIGRAENKVIRINFRAFIEDIVLSGLRILKDLKPDKFTLDVCIIMGMYAETTMRKSSTFQESLKYDPLFRTKP